MSEGLLLPPLILELRAKAGEVRQELREVNKETRKLGEESEHSGSRSQAAWGALAGAGKALVFGIAGAAAAVGAFGIEASLSAEQADARLRTAINNVGGSMEELEPKIHAADDRLRQFGFTNADTNTALATLTTALGSPTKAFADLQLAADLARQKNIPLAESALLVAKAAEGQTRPLKALGIDLPIMAGGAKAVAQAHLLLAGATQKLNTFLAVHRDAVRATSKYHLTYLTDLNLVHAAQDKLSAAQRAGTQTLAALAARVHGGAAAFGETLAGKVAIARAQLDNMGEKVGAWLIPKLTALLGVVSNIVAWFGRHTTTAKILAGVLGGVLAVAIGAYIARVVEARVQSAITFAQTIAGWLGLGNAAAAGAAEAGAAEDAMAASADAAGAATEAAFGPIGLIIAGVTIAITLLATHWKQVWGVIKDVTGAVWNGFLKPVFSAIWNYGLHPLVIAVEAVGSAFAAAWNGIGAVVSAVWGGFLKPTFGLIGTVVGMLVTAVEVLAQVWLAEFDAIRAAVEFVWDNVLHPIFNGIGAAFQWVGSVIGGVWRGVIEPVWNGIENGVSSVYRVIVGVLNAIGRAWSSLWGSLAGIVESVVNTVGRIAGNIWNGVTTGFKDVVNGVIWMLNKAIGFVNTIIHGINDSYDWIPGTSDIPDIPSIPYLARGGMTTGATLAMIGDNPSGHELVLPMDSPRTVDLLAAAINRGASAGHLGGDGAVIELHVHNILDGREIAHAVERRQLQAGLRRGTTYAPFRKGG